MAKFDLFHVKITGVADDGFTGGEVSLGFWDEDRQVRKIIDIPTAFQVSLDSSLRDAREQAKAHAIALLEETLALLEKHTCDELHELAQEQMKSTEESFTFEPALPEQKSH